MTIKAVLFDLDGTLVDSIPDLLEATRRMLNELGEPTRSGKEIKRFVGKGFAYLVEQTLTQDRAPKTRDELDHAMSVFARHYSAVNGVKSKVYPDVIETLKTLQKRGVLMACVTNKSIAFTGPLLALMKLSRYFECVVSGDTLPQKKPAPQPLLHACKLLGVSVRETIMVGDSIIDAQAAQAAGIPVLLVTYGYSESQPVDTIKCDGLVSSFAELPDCIDALASTRGSSLVTYLRNKFFRD
ncbi:MAG TPA: phosphoglycolate phosphatase [Rhodocyclaceae bacterium]|nr:phosphoglycolate phosphatase [Rhodocyclaceae bacterium]